MLKTFRADLHIHSCLSPCGEEEMRPRALVNQAMAKGLDMIAICDHNSAENTAAFIRAGDERGLKVLPGIEVTSKEEIHLIALFDTQEELYSSPKSDLSKSPRGKCGRGVWSSDSRQRKG